MAIFKKKTSSNVGQQQQGQHIVGDSNNNKRYENQIVVVVKSINLKDSTSINRLSDGGKIFTFRPYRQAKAGDNNHDKNGSVLLEFVINVDRLDDFKKLLPNIVDILRNSKNYKYSDEFLNSFERIMIDRLNSVPSSEEINNSRDRMTKNWKELVATINDPAVRQRIVRKSFIYTDVDGETKSVTLSSDNVQRVLLANPSAIFVTDESTWYRIFKRKVVNRNNYILITKPLHTWISKQDKETACQELYGAPYADVVKKYTDKIQRQQFEHGLAKYWTRKEGRVLYEYEKVYDVSDTELIDQNDDPWSKMIINNNLTGEKNQNIVPSSGAENVDDGDVRIGLSEEILQRYRDWLFKKCRDNKIDVSQLMTLPADQAIYHAVYKYAFVNADKLNQVREEDRRKVAVTVSLAMCAHLGIRGDFSQTVAVSDELARLSWPLFLELLPNEYLFKDTQAPASSVSMVSENVSDNFNDYLKLLKTAGVEVQTPKDAMLEEFFDMLTRMNSSKHNLRY